MFNNLYILKSMDKVTMFIVGFVQELGHIVNEDFIRQ